MKQILILLLILAYVITICHTSSSFLSNSENNQLQYLQQLYQLTQNTQCQENQNFRTFLPQFQKFKGLYESEVKFNYLEKSNSYIANLIRTHFGIYDNNVFVTNFVLYALIEAYGFEVISLDENSFSDAINALLEFQDLNQPANTPVYAFWKEVKNGSYYVCQPENLIDVINLSQSMPKWIGEAFAKLVMPSSVAQYWTEFMPLMQQLKEVFSLPSDTDDTSLNLMLGSLLRNNQNDPFFSSFYDLWESKNNNYQYFFNLLKQFAYRPFNQLDTNSVYPPDCDQIDPRTYFALHQFLDEIYENATSQGQIPNIALPTTWILNLETEVFPEVAMPANVNNVDLSVNANILFGLTHFLLSVNSSFATEIFDNEIKQLYNNATSLLQWGIESNRVMDFPNLCLLYYPNMGDFFWFIARTLNLLESYKNQNGKLPFEELERTRQIYSQIMKNVVTKYIQDQAQVVLAENNYAYWDGFLGDYGNITRGDDRVFTTAVMLNALLDTWTIKIPSRNSTNKNSLIWIDSTPQTVKDLVEQGTYYLQNNILYNDGQLYNAFFSGSVKLVTSMIFLFPSNVNYDVVTKKQIDPHETVAFSNFSISAVQAMKGYINSTEYDHMLNDEKWGGYHSVDFFFGYNYYKLQALPMGFPFWSSQSITYALSMLAITKDLVLQQQYNNQ